MTSALFCYGKVSIEYHFKQRRRAATTKCDAGACILNREDEGGKKNKGLVVNDPD